MDDSLLCADERIYHVVAPLFWDDIKDFENFPAESLNSEGFIHCCFASQLEGVLQRYFRGKGELVVIEIDASRLKPELRVEASTGNEAFPHCYGEINADAVIGKVRISAPD